MASNFRLALIFSVAVNPRGSLSASSTRKHLDLLESPCKNRRCVRVIVIRMRGCGWCWDMHRYPVSMIMVPVSSVFVHAASRSVFLCICVLLHSHRSACVCSQAGCSCRNIASLPFGEKFRAPGV